MNSRKEQLAAFNRLLDIMDELREKCPWDKKQTLESLRHLTIEETYELADAILDNDLQEIKKELEERLIIYAVNIVKLTNYNSTNYAGIHLSKQIIRSSTSSPLNYGEAQAGESPRDFLHKTNLW